MSYDVKILLDSVNNAGVRLVTWELTYPRFVHSELMTHRWFSRSSASSRAIPYTKMRERIMVDPVIPVWWGKNQPGMQAEVEMELHEQETALKLWLQARDGAVMSADDLHEVKLHKQLVNRIVEPWMWITVIMSTTYHANWFEQRDHRAAQPEIREMAAMMHDLYWSGSPTWLKPGDWHMPLMPDIQDLIADGFTDVMPPFHYNSTGGVVEHGLTLAAFERTLQAVSAGRCARVSYLNHHGVRDPNEDLTLFARMSGSSPAHRAPLEHVAVSMGSSQRTIEQLDEDVYGLRHFGNFQGFKQLRHFVPREAGPPEPRFDPRTGRCVNYDPSQGLDGIWQQKA